VLPDACIDLVWDGATLMVAGPDTRATPIGADGSYLGIRFRPGAGPAFLGTGADALADTRVMLTDLWGSSAQELQFRLHDDPAHVSELLEEALLRRLPDVAAPDPLVDALLRELTCARLGENAANLADSLCVSERTLRRRCTTALGYGPKTLERILRFRRALRLLRNRHPLADTARLAGYADQAHLTNEAQRLAGLTPGALAATPNLSISTNGCD
jgi:AraC-like DNA-binding protein